MKRIIGIDGERDNMELIFIVHVDELDLMGRLDSKLLTVRTILQ